MLCSFRNSRCQQDFIFSLVPGQHRRFRLFVSFFKGHFLSQFSMRVQPKCLCVRDLESQIDWERISGNTVTIVEGVSLPLKRTDALEVGHASPWANWPQDRLNDLIFVNECRHAQLAGASDKSACHAVAQGKVIKLVVLGRSRSNRHFFKFELVLFNRRWDHSQYRRARSFWGSFFFC